MRELEFSPRRRVLPGDMDDLDIPENVVGPYSPSDKERWLVCIEKLLARGHSIPTIRKQLGLPLATARLMGAEVQARWSVELTPAQFNVRRETLYTECDSIKNFAWAQIESNEELTPAQQQTWAKLILVANARQSQILGVVHNVPSKDLQPDDSIPSLSEQQLRRIGGNVARNLKSGE